MKRFAILLLLGIAPVGVAFAQSSSKAVVNVSAAGPAAPVRPGQTFEVPVTLTIRSGYHINAQKPSEDYLIGTSLTIQPPSGVTVVKTAYPQAKYAKFSFSENPLAVFEGTVRIIVTLKTSAAATGQVEIPGKVQFQACNDSQCLPPSTVDVSATIDVAADDAAKTQTLTVEGAPPGASVSVDGRPAGRTNDQGRVAVKDVTPGRHKVRVELDGYSTWEQSVEVAAQPVTVSASLTKTLEAPQPDTPAAAAPSERPSEPVPAPVPSAPSESMNPMFVVGGAVVGVLVALGVYAITRRR